MTLVSSILLAVSFAIPTAEFAKYHREITGRDPAFERCEQTFGASDLCRL